MTSRKPTVIVSGHTQFTGRFVSTQWSLRIDGMPQTTEPTLKGAKMAAELLGASGKWERTKRLDGRHMRTYYTEIMENQP
jgi:hypothetical protein